MTSASTTSASFAYHGRRSSRPYAGRSVRLPNMSMSYTFMAKGV